MPYKGNLFLLQTNFPAIKFRLFNIFLENHVLTLHLLMIGVLKSECMLAAMKFKILFSGA